jgi:hypothetical protein
VPGKTSGSVRDNNVKIYGADNVGDLAVAGVIWLAIGY